MRLPLLDVIVLVVYVAGVVAFGCWFIRRSRSTEQFMVAARSLPGWAVGLSIFGTFLSSNTFIGYPGVAYGGNWNQFVFSISLPIAAVIAVKVFVPFFRRTGEISAYHHLEGRFGPWARTYAVVFYLLMQLARIGSIMFGVALALNVLTGWPLVHIIITMGALITLYTLVGGIEAVIWTDVAQSVVLVVGVVVVGAMLLAGMPGGPGQVFSIAAAEGKFSLGRFSLSLSEPTFWVVLAYGIVINLKNFGIDQSYVQRYHAVRSERAAARSVWLGALLYVPVSALFLFVGTSLYAYHQAHPAMRAEVAEIKAEEVLRQRKGSFDAADVRQKAAAMTDEEIGDRVLPHYIVSALPPGLTGLLIAALFAATMSSIDTSLNSSATVTLSDFYNRYWRPAASEKESMRVLHVATLFWGAVGTGVALALIGVESVLKAWWTMTGSVAGGMLGLFLLGILARRVTSRAAATGAILGLLVIAWLALSFVTAAAMAGVGVLWLLLRLANRRAAGLLAAVMAAGILAGHLLATQLELWHDAMHLAANPLHQWLTPVIGTATIVLVGLVAGLAWNHRPKAEAVTAEGAGSEPAPADAPPSEDA